jgi:hypothetical protein
VDPPFLNGINKVLFTFIVIIALKVVSGASAHAKQVYQVHVEVFA